MNANKPDVVAGRDVVIRGFGALNQGKQTLGRLAKSGAEKEVQP